MANIRPITVTIPITDVSTAQTITAAVTDGMVGKITQIKTCLAGNISNGDFNTLVTVSKNATVLGTISIQGSGSAAGDIDTLNITSNNGYIVVGDYLKVVCDGVTTIAAGALLSVDILR